MRILSSQLWSALAALATAGFVGCSDTASQAPDIDAYIRALPYLPADEPTPPTPQGDAQTVFEDNYQCRVENYSETGQYDKIVAYAANSESLWPGALLAGDSVYSGLFTQVVLPRRPLAVSVSLSNLQGQPSATVEEPSLSTTRTAIAEILAADVVGATPAQLDFQSEEVHSREQLSLALDASVDWGSGQVEAGFDFNKASVKSRYLIKFTQAYYTVDIDEPAYPSDVFDASVSLDEVEGAFDAQNPPLIVSSVTYGRMVVFTLESNKSSQEIGAALSLALNSGTQIGIDLSAEQRQSLEESNIHAFVLGGSGSSAVQAVSGIEGIKQFISEGGNYSRESPGAPIAYKLKHLKDNSPARLSITTDYDVKICDKISDRYSVKLKSLTVLDEDDSGDELEIYGNVFARGAGSQQQVWGISSGQRVDIGVHETYPSGASANTFLGETVIDVTPQPGNNIILKVDLEEYDGMSSDDDIDGTLTLPFGGSAGWSGDFDVMASGGGNLVKVTFTLTPIL